jgi:hypothetical protein
MACVHIIDSTEDNDPAGLIRLGPDRCSAHLAVLDTPSLGKRR